jgi:hypothetical protein
MKLKFAILLALACASTAFVASAQNPYAGFAASVSTSTGVAYNLDPGTTAGYADVTGFYGNEITLSPSSTLGLTSFTFSYYANYDLAGGITVQFYQNNGGTFSDGVTPKAPGTLLYPTVGTSTFDLKNTGSGAVSVTIPFNPANAILPNSTFTYLVSFSGISPVNGTHAGLLLPNTAPTVGTLVGNGADYIHETSPGVFALEHFNPVVMPEPSTVALAGAAGAAWLAFAGYRRFRK